MYQYSVGCRNERKIIMWTRVEEKGKVASEGGKEIKGGWANDASDPLKQARYYRGSSATNSNQGVNVAPQQAFRNRIVICI